jgi:PmbA protein
MLSLIEKLHSYKAFADLYYHALSSTSYQFENLQFKTCQKQETEGFGLRVINSESQEGFSSSNTLDNTLVERALHLAKLGERVYYTFPKQKQWANVPTYDTSVQKIEEEWILSAGKDLLESLNQEYKDYQFSFSYGFEESETKLVNTSGFNDSYKESICYASLSFVKAHNDQILQLGESITSRGGIFSLEPLVKEIREKIALLENPLVKIVQKKHPIILSAQAFASFLNILLLGFDGNRVSQGTSLIKEKVGEKIAPSFFSLFADGLHPQLLASSPFDDEGIASSTIPLILGGICKEPLYDLKTGAKEKKDSLGYGVRSTASLPSMSLRNIIIDEGGQSFSSLLESLQEGIYIESLVGAGMSNVLAGEFSANIGIGYLIKNGKISGRLQNTMINSNVFEMLENLKALSKERKKRMASLIPYALFENISIVSA